MSKYEEKVYDTLMQLKVPYKVYKHKNQYSCREGMCNEPRFEGQYCKNLFLKNSKGNIRYLLILKDSKKADLKLVAKVIGSTRLSFESELAVYEYLKTNPGAVTPFGLINDINKEITVIIDKELLESRIINFYPNINSATIALSYRGLSRFFEWCGNKICYLDI